MKVLITAPTGYVGRQLLRRLGQERGIGLRVITPDARRIRRDLPPGSDLLEADPFDPSAIRQAVRDIDVAYFPIRFTSLKPDFEAQVEEFARIFRDSCIEAGVRRVIYLGSRINPGPASPVRSTMPESADVLCGRPGMIQTICLFAGVIIGPGSGFYEMVMDPVKKLPLLFLPLWTKATVWPVALWDVVEYLARAAFLKATGSLRLEIGGEGMTVGDLFRLAAAVRGSPRLMVPVPIVAPRFSAVLLTLGTPFSYPVSLSLVRLLEATREERPRLLPHGRLVHFSDLTPMACEEAVAKALAATDADEVEGRWTDSLVGISFSGSETEMRQARYKDERLQDFGSLDPAKVFRSLVSLGGEKGWFTFDFLWRVRGLMDKLMGGFGTSLGRRSATDLRIGDMLDVWRVIDLVEGERLLLEAQMAVFGKAWLEFRISGTRLIQTAYYEPDGLLGKLYWFSMLPFHALIFPDMSKSIIRRARAG